MRIMLIVRMPLIPSFHMPFSPSLHLFGYYGQVEYFRMRPKDLMFCCTVPRRAVLCECLWRVCVQTMRCKCCDHFHSIL